MYRTERWPEEEQDPPPPPPPRSRSSSRRSSASLSRRSSLKKEQEARRSPMNSAPATATSTPKKTVKPQNLEFMVTGKQIVKRTDRANSLPGACRRPSDAAPRARKLSEAPRRAAAPPPLSPPTPHHETALEEDMSLDLSQVSDFEDTISKYGINRFATSTPLGTPATPATPVPTPGRARGKPRSASLQSQLHAARVHSRRAQHDHAKHSFASSRDSSIFNTSTSTSSPHRGGELDYSSVSPEYSEQSSVELSPRTLPTRASQQALSPRSHDATLSSCCVSTWAECSEAGAGGADGARAAGALDGEWCAFWANYNNSLPSAPLRRFYDRCPTPYRTDAVDPADWEFADGSRKRSPEHMEAITDIIRSRGLQLTARETQSVVQCAHLLGSLLTRAMERCAADHPDLSTKKKTMTLPLKETSIPLDAPEEKKCETATTQTDISLPNTKSAPRIFENILRQLSRSSIDVEKIEKKEKNEEEKSSEVKSESEVKAEVKNEIKKED
ncbi:hypothetical protein PYW08_012070 [Mythimna loreyi]|uniref:Uncharacterized protein n=1 Tax=Mythimna loreyi TaxID=667449 RepID=A0ACC2Q105_9NEOP|nr:hypothetical protein PYW08_012070 [Mythimna loreyi]